MMTVKNANDCPVKTEHRNGLSFVEFWKGGEGGAKLLASICWISHKAFLTAPAPWRPYFTDTPHIFTKIHHLSQVLCKSKHQVSPSPFLSSSSHTTQTVTHTVTLTSTSYSTLYRHILWSAQAVRNLKIDHTQRHLSTLHGTWSA